MLTMLLNGVLLALLASGCMLLVRGRAWARVLAGLWSVFLTAQLFSLYALGQWLGYDLLANTEPALVLGFIGDMRWELAAALLVLGVLYGIFSLRVWQRLAQKLPRTVPASLMAGALSVMAFTPDGVLPRLAEVYTLNTVEKRPVQELLPADYIYPEQVSATAGKNIVVISVESLERGFLHPGYGNVTPRLNALKKRYTYRDMAQGDANFTAGSLYTLLTGLPPLYPTLDNTNYWFQGVSALKISTLGTILHKSGYDMKYLMSDIAFAGMDDLLKANHFQLVSDKKGQNLGAFTQKHDLDLFREARLQVEQSAKSGKPFAVFLSTIDTHFPNGLYDARMAYPLQAGGQKLGSKIDFAIQAADYLIGDFIAFLEKEKLLENTVFYIFPDHQMMGVASYLRKARALDSGLYVISNAQGLPERVLRQSDLPRLIVDSAGIKTNARFVPEYEGVAVDTRALATLNASITERIHFKKGFELRFEWENGQRTLGLYQGKDKLKTVEFGKGKWLSLIFNQDFILVEHESRKGKFPTARTRVEGEVVNPILLSVRMGKKGISKVHLGRAPVFGRYIQPKDGVWQVTPRDIAQAIQDNRRAQQAAPESNYVHGDVFYLVTAHSSLTEAQLKTGKRIRSLQKGLNLFYTQKGKLVSQHLDSWAELREAERFVKTLETLKASESTFLMVAKGGMQDYNRHLYQQRLEQLGLPVLAGAGAPWAYVAIYHNTVMKELSDPRRVSMTVPNIFFLQEGPQSTIDASEYAGDPLRFIAHAGGAIDGKDYTNSLEAMEQSYQNGFKLFELDILKSSDGYFVAAHDWKSWKKKTGYKGKTPVTREVFLKHKVHGQYTPMDMERINRWFSQKKDAILVTDKVNEPAEIASLFVDKKRLMMEIFSAEKLQEAFAVGIKAPIPTAKLWHEIRTTHPELIKKVEYVAAGRTHDAQQIEAINGQGVKIFAFFINYDPKATERWVICNERQKFYGFYADDTSFLKQPIDCAQPH